MFVCSNCGYESTKWLGKCPSCGEWDSFKQIKVAPDYNNNTARKTALSFQTAISSKGLPDAGNRPLKLQEISSQEGERICTPDDELNRVLGGGLVPGSLVLLGGEPGIGKSTLADGCQHARETHFICVGRRKCAPNKTKSRKTAF